MLPWFSRAHKMSSFLSFVQNASQQLKFLSQQTLLSVQNRATMWFLFTPFAHCPCLEAWGLKGPSNLHFPPGRYLFISVPLNTHGEAGQPWGQEWHENAGVSILTLSQASFQALSISTSLLLPAHFSVIPPLVFPSHFHLVLLLH